MAKPTISWAATRQVLRTLGAEQDRRVAERAVELALLAPEHLARALAEEAPGVSLAEILLARGWIGAGDLASIQQAIAQDDFLESSAAEVAAIPAEVARAAADPRRELDEFVMVETLGRGGAGEVWKAWDRRLGRWVALKLLATSLESKTGLERFFREAHAAARLAHPNIIQIFGVRGAQGRPYLVMAYVDGQTLHDAKLPIREALEIVRTAALAVDHAHRRGVIHRDLKPANVMIDREGRVYILDFGLAFLLADEARQLTQPGDLLGTAAYMSPEQARGESSAHGVATDVYGLGATLYHLATRKAPFEGASFPEIAARVARDEPVRPRVVDPALAPDVETVVLKAMEKDPKRRYGSAADLAEDLRRVLDHEPIVAHSSGVAGRVYRRIKRRAALYGAAAALLLAVAAIAGARFWIAYHREAAIDAVRETARLSLETALRLRRAGDYAGMGQVAPKLWSAYRRAQQWAPDLPEVEYLMGRMDRAIEDDDKALAHQERALAKDPAFAPALYERAILRARRYGAELERELASPRPVQGSELAKHREAIIADCRRLQSLGGSAVDALAARGILAFHEGMTVRARELLATVVKQDPSREEAWEYLGKAVQAEGRLDEAERIFSDAIAHDRGYFRHFESRCALRLARGNLAGAVDDASHVVAEEPEAAAAFRCRGMALTQLGEEEARKGGDPLASFAKAGADLDETARRDAGNPASWVSTAQLSRQQATFRISRGLDPGADLTAAESKFSRAIDLDGSRPEGWSGRGRTRWLRASHQALLGQDPGKDLAAAEHDLSEAIKRGRTSSHFWVWRGDVAFSRALHRFENGGDPLPDLSLAEGDYTQSIEHRETDDAFRGRGVARALRGRALARLGREPLPDWAASEQDLRKAIALDPTIPDTLTSLGTLQTDRAVHSLRPPSSIARHRIAARDLRRAEESFGRALALDPKHATAWAQRGRLRQACGHRTAAVADFRQALTINGFLEKTIAPYLAQEMVRPMARAAGQ